MPDPIPTTPAAFPRNKRRLLFVSAVATLLSISGCVSDDEVDKATNQFVQAATTLTHDYQSLLANANTVEANNYIVNQTFAAEPINEVKSDALTAREDAAIIHGSELRIATGAGVKDLRLIDRDGRRFTFEMNMGRPAYSRADLRLELPLDSGMQEVVALSVGNPQCVVFVESFDFDWRRMGAEIERYPHFQNRTNVSFVRRIDAHTLEVRFFERGVGETLSSGTGSTGAMAAAVLRGVAESPVRIVTPAGPIDLRWAGDIYLTGPAEIVAAGAFYAERIPGEASEGTE